MTLLSGKKRSLFRLSILLFWGILVLLLIKREVFVTTITPGEMSAVHLTETEEFLSILFQGKKIGYGVYRYTKADSGWHLEQQAQMKLNIGGTSHPVKMSVQAELSDKGVLDSFRFSFASPFYHMKGDGTVSGNDITYSLYTGSSTIRDTIHFPSPPILPTSRRGYLLERGIQEGEKVRIPWFDPITLSGRESTLEYRGVESVLINGRVERLHRFIESSDGIRASSWLDDKGKLVKEESPAGFVFLKEPKFRALSGIGGDENGPDILSAVAVQPKAELVKNDQQMRYRLSFPEADLFDVNGGRQRFDGSELTITAETAVGTTQLQCSPSPDTLQNTPYIQSDSPKIQERAAQIVGSAQEGEQKIQELASWVYENLEKRPVLGLPDALSTLNTRRGDCNEHASLFAALARASGLPTRMVAGVTFARGAFYYHAWNEVCTDRGWLSVDTTTNQIPADLTHIRFVHGEFQDQMRISALLGNLSITPLSDAETITTPRN